jgi:RimJ/RimL family protein N-acetyltransferase
MQNGGSRAFRIETPRLVIRCWDADDARLLKDAVDTSLDHLRPWMPWAEGEPTTLDQKRQLLARFAEDFARGDDAVYGIFEPDERRVVGGTGLHPRLDGNAREIGYWIRAGATGRGLAGESTAALTRVAFEVDGVDRMEIHCDPANARSVAIPRRLGYELADGLDGNGHLVFRMLRAAYPGSPTATATAHAYDDAGARVL